MTKILTAVLVLGLISLALTDLRSAPAAASTRLDDHEALEKCMKELKGAMRRMRKSIADPEKKAENLEQIAVLQRNFVTAKSLIPGVAAKSEKKDEMVLKYRGLMLDCLEKTIAMERAVLAGKGEEAEAAMKALHELQDSGHSEFKVEDD